MFEQKTVFIDFDNTLMDQFQLNLQFTRAIGAMMAAKFGGNSEVWAKHATDMIIFLEEGYLAHFVGKPLAGYTDWLAGRYHVATQLLFQGMGLSTPPNAAQLAKEIEFSALSSCNAAFPGAYQALQTLFEDGCHIHIASANDSEYLRAGLIGAGMERFVERTFGPDLIDCAKEGVEFFTRIFAETGVTATDAVVVDDLPEVIHWALQTGAKVVQVKVSPERHVEDVPGVAAVVTDLYDLPRCIQQIAG